MNPPIILKNGVKSAMELVVTTVVFEARSRYTTQGSDPFLKRRRHEPTLGKKVRNGFNCHKSAVLWTVLDYRQPAELVKGITGVLSSPPDVISLRERKPSASSNTKESPSEVASDSSSASVITPTFLPLVPGITG